MRTRAFIISLCLLCASPVLTAQTTDDSSAGIDPFWAEFFPQTDDDSSREIPKQVSKEDSLYYISLSDSIIPVRSGVTGDTRENPIGAGGYSDSFSYTDTRNTVSFTHQYGRYTKDVFYRFVLSVPMNVTLTHQGSMVNDTYMYLLDSYGNLIASNDDYSGEGHCANTQHAFIRRQLAAGEYFVVSEGYISNGYITTNITGSASTTYSYPTIPSSYSTMPGTAVGGMGAAFGVSAMGGATCSIPIEVPPGLGDMQPNLSIVYNSQAGNGLCGYGANLSGISVITRGPKDIYHDGSAQGMKYLADDALYLDGVRLILVSGTAGQEGAIYNPESDPFTQVISHGTCTSTSNNIWFEVRASNGITYRYGYDQNSRLTYTEGNSQRVQAWYLYRAQRTIGNHITYSYLHNDNCLYPYQISYGGNIIQNTAHPNVVEFTYEARNDSVPIRFDGHKGSMKKRLKTITARTNNTTYRTYTLDYNTTGDGTAYKFSRLTGVTEKNGQDESLPSTQLNWSYLPAINYSASLIGVQPSATSFDDEKYSTSDLNGDGISDIIGSSRLNDSDSSSIVVNRYLSGIQADGSILFTPASRAVFTPSITSGSGFSNSYLNMINEKDFSEKVSFDFDGDGLDEYVVPCRYRDINIFNNQGYDELMGFFMLGADGGIQHAAVVQLETSCTPLYAVADFDNDGRTDIMVMETAPMDGYDLFLYRMHIISSAPSPSNPYMTLVEKNMFLRGDPRRMVCADMNGNGLADILILYDNSYSILWNQGGEISIPMFGASFSQSDIYNCYGTDLKNGATVSFGDFNGDGLLDVITRDSDSSDLYFHLNNGNGTMKGILAYNLPDNFSSEHLEVLDIDADGMSDVIMTGIQFRFGLIPKVLSFWLCSDGSSLTLVDYASSIKLDDLVYFRYITGDFDGDGRVELVNYGYDCVNGNDSNSDPVWRIYKNSSLTVQSGKVTSMTGDFGVTTDITYSTLADGNVYTRGTAEPYPAPRYTIPLNVVKQTVQGGGAAGDQTVKYSYTGLKAHLQGKGLLGFSKTVANNTTSGVKAESGITQWDNTFYIPKVTYSKTTYNGHTEQTTSTLAVVDKQYKKYFAYPSVTVNTDMYGYSVTTRRHYNTEYGYITSDTAYYGTGMFRATRYHNYTQQGGAFHPQTIVTGQRHPDDNDGAFTVTTTYLYNNHGLVTRKTENRQSADSLATVYTYDSWGNLTSQVSTGNGITTPCTTYYTYDATHRFPVRIYTSPASSVKKYTYNTWGNVLTEQDSINSTIHNTVTHTYDHWGNLTKTKYADGSEVTYTRGWNNDAGKRYFVLTQGTARPWVKTWYDNSGREVRTESVCADNVSVVSTVNYNAKGQVTSRSSTEGSFTTGRGYTYDNFGRLFREQGPGGLDITHNYSNQSNGTVTETVNENSRGTTYVRDAWGNIKSVTAPISSVSNTYSSNGGIKTTTSGGATWTFQYDDRGNRTAMTDPDAGTTTYVYDALGRETKRTDARNIAFVTKYDYLGRVTQRKAGSETINYTYWTSGNGQLSLKSESYNEWTKSYTYDALGRVTQETMSKGNTISKSRSYTYDSGNGLLTSRNMPGGKTVQYTYDTYGNTTDVDFESGTIAWSLTGYTGLRTTSQVVLDNYTSPFEKTILLDQYGNLDSLKTIQPSQYGSLIHQNEKLTFDPIRGNLTQKQGQYDTYPVLYTYDNADRLRTATDTYNNQLMTVTYSANGNIATKTGIGSYTYGNTSKPHAVTEVDNTNGKIAHNYQEVSYNSWGKMNGVWQTDATDFYNYSVSYGPDLQRVESSLDKTYNNLYHKFYWDDYEEKTTGSLTTRYWYINGPDGLIGIYIEEQTPNGTVSIPTVAATDHLGSIEGLFGNNNYCYYAAKYDEWGDRNVLLLYGLSHDFDRGYTGHEHIDGLGLINMNGRMYDPKLGRFLSPDPFVQAPSNPQNFNRYSYCLNNPLKYTDTTGELFGIDDAIAACIIAATVSAAIDYGSQVLINYACGYTGKDAWFNKVDFFDIAVSGVVGAVSAGYGAATKAGTKLGKFGEWVVGHGNEIKAGEMLLTSAVDITGEGFQDISGEQFVSRVAIGMATQAATDAVVKHSSGPKVDNSFSLEEQIDHTSLSSKPDNLIKDNGGNYSVYKGIDEATGKVKYIGITSREPQIRFEEHLRSKTPRSSLRYFVLPNAQGLSKTNARIWEQNLINQYGLENLYNKINSISPSYWNQYNIK